MIASGSGIGMEGEESTTPERSDIADRKRLKERLKEAAAMRSTDADQDAFGSTSLIEKIFGIREGDSRAGKERSRYRDGISTLHKQASKPLVLLLQVDTPRLKLLHRYSPSRSSHSARPERTMIAEATPDDRRS